MTSRGPRERREAAEVLVIVDDEPLRASLRRATRGQGIGVAELDPGTAPESMLDLAPQVVIVDLDIAGDEATAWLVTLRTSAPGASVIALSSRAGEGDKIAALDAGADDYLTKPIATGELMARIRVALRRFREAIGERGGVLEVGPLRIDDTSYCVTVDGKDVHLTPTEFRLLRALAAHPGEVRRRDQLLRELWGHTTGEQVHNLRVHIAALRQKIERDPARPRWLVTVTGIGYRLRG